MSGPFGMHDVPARSPMCDRCSTPWTVRLEVDAVDPADRSPHPAHHVTVMHVCDDHVSAALGVIVGALNARPGRLV